MKIKSVLGHTAGKNISSELSTKEELRIFEFIDQLNLDLRHRDDNVRKKVASDPRNAEILISALKSNNARMRERAAYTLNYMKDPRVVEPLIAALKDDDAGVRNSALSALRNKEKEYPHVVELLIAALQDNDSRVRHGIAYIFGYSNNPRVVEPLITLLKDKDPDVRYSASNSLIMVKDLRAVEPLIAALKDNNEAVRRHAAAALGERSKDPRVVEPLIDALKDDYSEVRRIAAAVLGEIQDPRAFKPLVALLNDNDSAVRHWLSSALIKIEDPRIFEPLIAALKDKDPMMRRNATSILEKKKEDPQIVEPLIGALNDSDPEVRQSAAYTLAYMKNPRATELLIDSLKDKDPEVIKLALMALRVKEREDQRIVTVLKDIDPSVRKLESDSLKKKGTGYQCMITGMDLVFVKGGCYQMGDFFGSGYADSAPVHKVCVDSFYIGKYEVTQEQWIKVIGRNPSHFSATSQSNPVMINNKFSDDYPVESVSWNDVQEFIRKLNFLSGKNYRLPTEAEWEYAARSCGKKERWAGTSNKSSIGDYAWIGKNSGGKTHPVGKKKSNGLGIYDMTGNVEEWCSDWFGFEYYSKSPSDNPKGPDSGSIDEEDGGRPRRVARGGHWNNGTTDQSYTTNHMGGPDEGNDTVGFRIVLPTR